MSIDQSVLKIEVIKLIELSYKSDSGLTASILKSKGPFTLKVDQDGKAVLSGKAGKVKFSAKENVKQLGVDLKFLSIMFFGSEKGLHYTASFNFFGGVKVEFTSIIDLEKLILSCSGLLCNAARLLKNRHKMIDAGIGE
ncbi:hypothetical protein [Neptunomonas phycophila]|jgi:hypothetical protein|uniref:hypothetical protein n=1 Tax=Neptunomonas phycophila TaxID=1572645 RepID=UPI001BE50D62|nr:hypothetical protein [Neptunomonas phycophila]MBT3146702.1 hypothetical protein [Neptunomonas phycophila]